MGDFVALLADPDVRPALLAGIAGLLLGLLLLILVHEAGHAVFGRLAGYRVRFVRIGRGPTLVRLRFGLALLDWRLLPISGGVAVYQPFVRRRHSRLILSAGGCIANAAAAGALLPFTPWPPALVMHPVLTPVLLCQAAGLLNLLVVPSRLGRTDGTILLAAARQRSGPNRALMTLYETSVVERYPSLPLSPPSRLGAVVLHALLLGTPEAGFNDRAGLATVRALRERDRLRCRLLGMAGLTPAERAVLLHAQVIESLLGAPDADLVRLDAWSVELAALLPGEPSARAARGAVLVLAGRSEGRDLLEADLATDEDPFGRGMRRAFLARAALDAGDRPGAAALFAAARVDLQASVEGEGFPLMAGLKTDLSTNSNGG